MQRHTLNADVAHERQIYLMNNSFLERRLLQFVTFSISTVLITSHHVTHRALGLAAAPRDPQLG